MRFAELDYRAEICDEYSLCNMAINVVTHLARLPYQQAALAIGNFSSGFRIDLPSQQRRCFEECTVGWVLLVGKLTHSRSK